MKKTGIPEYKYTPPPPPAISLEKQHIATVEQAIIKLSDSKSNDPIISKLNQLIGYLIFQDEIKNPDTKVQNGAK